MTTDTKPTHSHNNIYFPNLDGFRTIAFLMVFFGHCSAAFHFGEYTRVMRYIHKIFGRADAGVNFFFVLSGFLISYLLLSENEKYKTTNIKSFYIRRILRI